MGGGGGVSLGGSLLDVAFFLIAWTSVRFEGLHLVLFVSSLFFFYQNPLWDTERTAVDLSRFGIRDVANSQNHGGPPACG